MEVKHTGFRVHKHCSKPQPLLQSCSVMWHHLRKMTVSKQFTLFVWSLPNEHYLLQWRISRGQQSGLTWPSPRWFPWNSCLLKTFVLYNDPFNKFREHPTYGFNCWYCMKRVKPTRCYTMVYWTLWIAQHVSGIIMPIVRSLRLYRWSQRMAPHLGYGRLLVWCMVVGFWSVRLTGCRFLERPVNRL